MKIDEKFDFGFSILSEEELQNATNISNEIESKEQEINRLNSRLVKVKEIILPLIQNLQKEPQKNYIYWPNRTELLQELMKKIRDT